MTLKKSPKVIFSNSWKSNMAARMGIEILKKVMEVEI